MAAVSGWVVASWVVTVASAAYQYQQQRKMRKAAKAAEEARKGFEVVSEGVSTDLPIVYGYAKIGGIRVFHNTTGGFIYADSAADKKFDAGPPERLPYTYTFEETSYEWLAKIDGYDHVVTTTEVTVPGRPSGLLNKSYGGSKNEFLWVQQALCQGPISAVHDVIINESMRLDDPLLGTYTTNGNASRVFGLHAGFDPGYNGGASSTNAPVSYYEIKNIKAAFRSEVFFGKNPQLDLLTSTNFGDRSQAKFTDMAFSMYVVRLDRDDPQFQGAVPDVQYLIEGKMVRTVVNGELQLARIASNNPAWCLLDYLLEQPDLTLQSCKGLSPDEIDLVSFEKAAAICDKIVGERPVGGQFWQPVDGSRSVKTQPLRLYECNIIVDTKKSFRENIEILLGTMGDARLVWSAGKYKLSLQYPETNEQIELAGVITDDELVLGEPVSIKTPDMSRRLNSALVRYHDDTASFQETSVSWPPKRNGVVAQGIGGTGYPPVSGWTNKDGPWSVGSTYGVWSGSELTTTLTWKFFSYETTAALLEMSADDSGTYRIFGPGVDQTLSSSGNSWAIIGVTLQQNSVYTIEASATNNKGLAAVIGRLRDDATKAYIWTTRSPAYADFIVTPVSDAIYQALLAEDNGVALEEDFFFDGCTDYYHALAKAEEMVRMSRTADEVAFTINLRDKLYEPGDIIRLQSETCYVGIVEPYYVRIDEVSPTEDYTAEVKGTRFDYSQLAWNVPDHIYEVPGTEVDFTVSPPVGLVYTPDALGIWESSQGRLSWDYPDGLTGTYFRVYILTKDSFDENGAPVFILIGETEGLEFFVSDLVVNTSYVFGVKAVRRVSGKESVMATTGPEAVKVFETLDTSVTPELTAQDSEDGVELSWVLSDQSPLGGRSMEIVKVLEPEVLPVDPDTGEELPYVPSILDAEPVGRGRGNSYRDRNVVPHRRYHYWGRVTHPENPESVPGPWSEVASVLYTGDYDYYSDATPPPGVTGVEIDAAYSTVLLRWDPAWETPSYRNHDYTEIWRSATSDFAAAVIVGTAKGNIFSDPVGTEATVYYWLNFVSLAGVAGPRSGPHSAQTAIPADVIKQNLLNSLGYEHFDVAAGAFPIRLLDSLPALPDPIYPEGAYVSLLPGAILHQNRGNVWVKVVNAVDMAGRITETQISDNAIKSPHISAGAIVAGKIDAEAVGANEIAANAVTSGKILAGAILADHIAVGEISADHLAANSVTTRSMAAGSINGDRITAGTLTVSEAEINDAAISTLKIKGSAVTVPVTSNGGYYGGVSGGHTGWAPEGVLGGRQRVNRAVMQLDEPGIVYAHAIISQGFGNGKRYWKFELRLGDSNGNTYVGSAGGLAPNDSPVVVASGFCNSGIIKAELYWYSQDGDMRVHNSTIFMMGAKR
jgi:hypothetical protein